MKQFNKLYLSITFFILVVLLASVFFLFKQSKEDRLASLGDHIVSNFRAGLAYEMADLLSFSLALSEDGELKNALMADDESKGYTILSKITERFKKYTHLKSLRIQVLTPDFFIFARSWNEGFEGMPIWWFRDDLKKLKRNKQPKVGMEIGRLLTFKATIPIRSSGKLLGYLEVIKFVDELAEKLHKKGIELFALMDERYLKQAVLMRDFPLLHGYVIVNQNFNYQIKNRIEHIDWHRLENKSYLYQDDRLFLLEPMYNGEGEKIGDYLLTLSSEAMKRYEKANQGISFFTQFSDEDIEEVVASWEHPYGSFRSGYDKDLIGLLPKLNKKDKIALEGEAKEILQEYTKEELIDIILSNKHNEKKIGEIE
ncbi:cache domain-containing protein [Sulfurovum sp.]|uniref:cache domain-containing protein n=1 Tax=Sulfurovum sp. TaxID=1969726 RepID=UPI0025EFA28E|nr:cache domain-containing protein [Sulfurovum sp.]